MMRWLPFVVFVWAGVIGLVAMCWNVDDSGQVHLPLYELVARAWCHKHLLLDPWAGPAFTLWAAPWTVFGPDGLQWANVLCFALTCASAAVWFRPAATGAASLFPVLLIAAPAYRAALFTGTNEVFFVLLATATFAALRCRSMVLAALIASLLPLVRPEWLVVLPCVALWLVGMRAWRALPWLLTGSGVYMMCGGGAPWAGKALLFERVQAVDLLHMFRRAPEDLGLGLVWLLSIAASVGALVWWSHAEERSRLRSALFLGMVPAVLVLLLHAVWGWFGREMITAGERPLAIAWPFAALFIGQVWTAVVRMSPSSWARSLMTLLAALLVAYTTWPWTMDPPAQQERPGLQAWLQQRVVPGVTVSINDPHWAHRLGLDPWLAHSHDSGTPILTGKEQMLWVSSNSTPAHLWVPLDRLLLNGGLRVVGVEHFAPDPYDTIPPLTLWTFGAGPEQRYRDTVLVFHGTGHPQIAHRLSLDTSAKQYPGRPCFSTMEFPVEFAELPINAPEFHATEILVSGVMQADSIRMEWVLSEEGPEGKVGYWPHAVWSGPFVWRMALPARDPAVQTKLYLWNRSDMPFCIADLKVELIRTFKGQ